MKKEKNLELDFNLSEETLNKIMQEDLTKEQIEDIAKEELTLQVGDIIESLLEEYETSDKKGKDDVIDALIGLVLSGYLKEEDCECEEENGVEIDTSELNNYTLDEEKFAEGLTDISHLAGMVSGLMSLGLNGENALTGALSLTLAKSDKERDLEIARINA